MQKNKVKKVKKDFIFLNFKQLFFILIVFILIFLSSCDNKTFNDKNLGYSFYTVKISDLNPKGVVYVDSLDYSKPLFIEVENEMFYDSSNFVIVPSNYNNFNIGLDSVKEYFKNNPWSFYGFMNENYDFNSKDVKSFDTNIILRPGKTFPYSANVKYYACSDVKTYFSESICFSGLEYDENSCIPKKTFYEGQGAPIGIVSVETDSAGSKGILKFTIANKYDGNVYLRSKSIVDECSFIPIEDYGKVKLEEVKISGKKLNLDSCSSKIGKLGFDKKYQKYKSYTFECVFDKKNDDFKDLFDKNVFLNVEILLSYSYSKLVKEENVVVSAVDFDDKWKNDYSKLLQKE